MKKILNWIANKFTPLRERCPFHSTIGTAVTNHQCKKKIGHAGGHVYALLLCLCVLCASVFSSRAQVTATYSSNMLTSPIVCQVATTNLATGLYNTNRVWQGKNLGISMVFAGGASSNNGSIIFEFAVLTRGPSGVMTTTHPFNLSSTANGTTPVIDWGVIPSTVLGPADCIALIGISNAAVNVNATYAAGSLTVSNLYLETDTRP